MNDGSVIEEHTVVGKPEFGYAVGKTYTGAGAPTVVGAGATVRAQAIIYGGVTLGANVSIGHNTLLRTGVTIGEDSQLAHGLTVERTTRIGRYVRCSPLSHITSSVVIEDRVFLGAGVVTINDKGMIWRNDALEPLLVPPHFEYGAKVGSGSTIGAGVRIGRESLVGSGSVVTRDVPAFAIAYGNPARVKGTVSSREE